MDPGQGFGARLRQFRTRAGMSRPVLAGLVGRSTEWLKAVEAGRLAMPRLEMLMRLCEALGIRDLAELTGDVSLSVASFSRGQVASVGSVRDAVLGYRSPNRSGPPLSSITLAGRAAHGWRL
jgi:transcriptional regulator with XRE-family HTH domain